jgi:glucosamine-6-phosphate deaminase
MRVERCEDKHDLGRKAAAAAGELIRGAIVARGRARIVVSTGASQFEFLHLLTADRTIPWDRVDLFHLDEYVGISRDHPASFRRYIRERILDLTGIRNAHLLDGEADPGAVCSAARAAVEEGPIDVAFVGIGENGHLAFNDPPADFETADPFIVVTLDEACRRQQVGEGWFPSVADVPARAITMSIAQILKARAILCIVPEARKAAAVKRCLEGEIGPLAPASALRKHADVSVFLDRESASLLGT